MSGTNQINRRHFLGGAGVAAVATTIIPSSITLAETKSETRADHVYEMREHAALYQKNLPLPDQSTNGDDELYPDGIASYTKALPHNAVGEVDREQYEAFTAALKSQSANLETIHLGGVVKLANPQAGLGFGLEGADSHHLG